MNKYVYIITQEKEFELKKCKLTGTNILDYSNWLYGIFDSFEEAEKVIHNNIGDLHEFYFDYVQIIKYRFKDTNVFPLVSTIYKWNYPVSDNYVKVCELEPCGKHIEFFNNFKKNIKEV